MTRRGTRSAVFVSFAPLLACALAPGIILAQALPPPAPPAGPVPVGKPLAPAPTVKAASAGPATEPGDVWCVRFSPDGKAVASCSGHAMLNDPKNEAGLVVLWDLMTGAARFTVRERLGVRSLAFSPDGKILALGIYDKTVKLLDAISGKELRVLQGHEDGVNAVAFSPGGKTLASASLDKTIKLWDVTSGKEIKTLHGHAECVLSVAFSPDGTMLASSGGNPRQPSRPGEAKLWDLPDGKERATLSGHPNPVEYVVFSPDGQTLATACWDGGVRLWDMAKGTERLALKSGTGSVMSAAFAPDGKTLATASSNQSANAGDVKLWDTTTGQERVPLRGHTRMVWSVEFSPDGRSVVSGAWDRSVRVWELATSRERAVIAAKPVAPAAPPAPAMMGRVAVARRVGGVANVIGRMVPAAPAPAKPAAPAPATPGTNQKLAITAKQVADSWNDLAAADSIKAYHAVWTLVQAGPSTVTYLKDHLRPAAAIDPDPKQIAQWIRALDNDDFTVREKASAELEKIAEFAESALRDVVENPTSAEVLQRAQILLDKLTGPVRSSEPLRGLRALETLEYVGTPAARAVLETMTKGTQRARLTLEAKASLERLDKRLAAAREQEKTAATD